MQRRRKNKCFHHYVIFARHDAHQRGRWALPKCTRPDSVTV
jgi:hypothetical protein